jgi:hypothetical protein
MSVEKVSIQSRFPTQATLNRPIHYALPKLFHPYYTTPSIHYAIPAPCHTYTMQYLHYAIPIKPTRKAPPSLYLTLYNRQD